MKRTLHKRKSVAMALIGVFMGAMVLAQPGEPERRAQWSLDDGASAQSMSRRSAEDEALRGLVEMLVEGWNRGNGEEFAAPFSDDADFIAFNGDHFKGRARIASVHEGLFQTFLKDSRIDAEIRHIRLVKPDVAVVHAVAKTIPPERQQGDEGRDAMQMFIATRENGQWQIVALQNARMLTIERQVFLDTLDRLSPEEQQRVAGLVQSLARDQ